MYQEASLSELLRHIEKKCSEIIEIEEMVEEALRQC
jgi:hypothetical protein